MGRSKKYAEDTAAEGMDIKAGQDRTEQEAAGTPGIEESFKRLEEILTEMEDEEAGLEKSFELYEEGLALVKSVNAGIDRVEKRMKILGEKELT